MKFIINKVTLMRTTSVVVFFAGALGFGGGLAACSDDDEHTPLTATAAPGADAATSTPPASTRADAGPTPEPTTDGGGGDAGTGDTEPPLVTITTPREDVAVAERRVVVSGLASDDVGLTELSYVVGANAPVVVPVAADGSFTFSFVPAPGKNTIEITARDATGNTTKAARSAWFGHRISVGNSQSAMLAGGKLYTWGRNELGQLGNGTLVGTWSADETATVPPMYEQPAADLLSVVTRQTFMIALAADGTVRTWGSNASGQLGYTTPADCGSDGTSPCGRAPATVPGISDAVAVAAGFDHALVLRADGTVLTFGSNAKGQLGVAEPVSTSTPTAVPGLSNVIALAAGSQHSVALTADGKVFVWGSNQYGQRGDGTSDTSVHATPAEVPGLVAASIASANHTVLARKADGTVAAWGQNNNGQVGNGTTTTVLTPATVLTAAGGDGGAPIPLADVESIAADGFVSLALDRDGNGYAWGLGSLGQLGQGLTAAGARDLANRTVASPIFVPPADKPSFVILELEVGAGGPALARTTQGKLFGWGWSFQGSLGGGTTLLNAWAYTTPRLVYPLP